MELIIGDYIADLNGAIEQIRTRPLFASKDLGLKILSAKIEGLESFLRGNVTSSHVHELLIAVLKAEKKMNENMLPLALALWPLKEVSLVKSEFRRLLSREDLQNALVLARIDLALDSTATRSFLRKIASLKQVNHYLKEFKVTEENRNCFLKVLDKVDDVVRVLEGTLTEYLAFYVGIRGLREKIQELRRAANTLFM